MDEQPAPVIRITLEGDDVWVRWPGSDSNVKLGPMEAVCEEMCRFLVSIDYGQSEWAP